MPRRDAPHGYVPGGETETLGDEFEEAMTGFVRLVMLANQAGRHLRVAVIYPDR